MNKLVGLAGKSVIVTSSSSGIGRATALAFAYNKAKVLITGRREDALETVYNECIKQGSETDHIAYIKADLTTEDGIEAVIDKSMLSFGGIDVLVNSAGILPVKDVTLNNYDDIFNLNVKSVYRLSQLALDHLQKSQGCIINVSSVAGFMPFPKIPVYCMSKAALEMFTKVLAQEMAPYNVRVNCVSPGAIKTPLLEQLATDESNVQQLFQEMGNTHPLKRCGDVQEVADLIAFLASDAASFITGVNIPVDGGLALTNSQYP